MRFLVDVGIGLDVSSSLNKEGHESVHLRDRGLQRLPDEEVLSLAVRENRIILTHDLDFGRLLALRGANQPSIITFRMSNMRPETVLARLKTALMLFESELKRGAALTLDDRSDRCRILPVE